MEMIVDNFQVLKWKLACRFQVDLEFFFPPRGLEQITVTQTDCQPA